MNPDQFRQLALEVPGSSESAHMGHPDFRVHEKIFASLGYPSEGYGMVKLTPEQQHTFMAREPDVFHPCNGAWGRSGSTNVRLSVATASSVRTALATAAKNVSLKKKPRSRA